MASGHLSPTVFSSQDVVVEGLPMQGTAAHRAGAGRGGLLHPGGLAAGWLTKQPPRTPNQTRFDSAQCSVGRLISSWETSGKAGRGQVCQRRRGGGKKHHYSLSFPSLSAGWERRAQVRGHRSRRQHREVTGVPRPGAAQDPPACLGYSMPIHHTSG